jgi:CRISPR-associated protein Csb1
MSNDFTEFTDLLKPDGPVAITVKQSLSPVNDDDPVVFPPSYPMTTRRGRMYTMRDGDYRVSVELPPDSKGDKNDRSSEQRPGYNIDRFQDGTNCCEIDSPQSQANRVEPKFKTRYPRLVPQIVIKVGADGGHQTLVNVLDAGHRAADAVVRMSSLASKFHAAFLDAKRGNYFTLATLAPTSLVFGVWDSRSTYVKIQRIFKAYIRASNVTERTRSAQFTPAADYVAAGAVDERLDVENLSAEGMKHALATQTVGGVALTKTSELTRFLNVNLAALRELRGGDETQTRALQYYVLALALIAATSEPDLNLREGCNLRIKEAADTVTLVPRRGEPWAVTFDPTEVERFADWAAEEFFRTAGIDFENKNYLDAVFETGVAEEFLAMDEEDRKKVSQLGPITAATIKEFHERGKDPFKMIQDPIKAAKKALGKAPPKKEPRIKNLEALAPVAKAIESAADDASLPVDALRALAKLAQEHQDSHDALKEIERELKHLKKDRKRQESEPPAGNSEAVS